MGSNVYSKFLKLYSRLISLLMISMLLPSVAAGQSWSHEQNSISGLLQGVEINQDVTKSAVLNKVISVKMRSATVLEALEEVAGQADLELIYNAVDLESANHRLTLNVEEMTINQALWTILEDTGFRYAVSSHGQLVIMKNPDYERMQRQLEDHLQVTVTGQVVDAQTGEALPGVNVIVEGSEEETGSIIGTQTNLDGNYSISVPDGLNKLVFTYIGYQRLEVDVDGRSEIDIQLQQDVQMLDDVVVIGYGVQRQEALTGSVGTISGGEILEQSSVSTSAALMGRVPGVQITQNSGQPGGDQGTIRIRGIGTLGNANPLILVDGIEGGIDDVASSDIENISILKDASAAAIYGSRAANGVVLITTKRGLSQQLSVNYNGNIGFQKATNLPSFVDAGTFMRLENIGATNLGAEPIWSEAFIQEWEANYPSDDFPNTNWVDAIFTETAMQQRHSISISGGSENATYRGAIQYDGQNGEIKNYNFERFNFRFNSDLTVSEKFSFVLDANAIRTDTQTPVGGLELITRQAFRLPAIYLDRFNNGNYGQGAFSRNPVAQIEEGGLTNNERNIFQARVGTIYKPFEGMVINLQYAPRYGGSHNQNMTKQWQSIHPETGAILEQQPGQSSRSESFNKNWQHNLNLVATFQQNYDNHSIEFLGGTEYISFRASNFGASRTDFPLQNIEVLNAGSAANMQNSGSASEWRLLSYFGRANYDFLSKYQVSANIRYDGSSRFTEDERWGVFPSFSVGWRIGQEPFMEPFEFLDELKIRGSWGLLGNQNIGNYPFAASINLGQNYIFGNQPVGGAAQIDQANPGISWETSKKLNLGADLIVFRDRLSVTIDWFLNTTEDILLQLPVPLIVGVNPAYQNAGEVENRGWELDLTYNETLTQNFSLQLGFNISQVSNKVTDLRGAGPFISGSTIIQEGSPINSLYGWKSDGLFQSQAEIDDHASQTGNIAPGDIRYLDLNNDGIINADDRTIIGDPFPSLNYGFNLAANYRNFNLSAFFQGVGRRDVMLQGDVVWSLHNAGNVQSAHVNNHWTPDNPNAEFPRLTQTTSHNNFSIADFWMADASYFRLRNLQFGYSLPQSVLSGLASDVRIYFSGQNIFTLDNMPNGIDPNIPNNTSGGYYPVQRVLSLGIDINF